MRRLFVILFIINITVLSMNCIASDNFVEINVKAGIQPVGKINVEYKNPSPDEKDKTFDLNTGLIFAGEFLILYEYFSESVKNFKFGFGFSYLPLRDYNKNTNISISYLPVYFTLQVNPFIGAKNEVLHGIFLKGNMGHNVLFDFKDKGKGLYNNSKPNKINGLHYAFSTGYEFAFGLIVYLSYNVYMGSIEISHYADSSVPGDKNYFANNDLVYRNITFDAGYKFKI